MSVGSISLFWVPHFYKWGTTNNYEKFQIFQTLHYVLELCHRDLFKSCVLRLIHSTTPYTGGSWIVMSKDPHVWVVLRQCWKSHETPEGLEISLCVIKCSVSE